MRVAKKKTAIPIVKTGGYDQAIYRGGYTQRVSKHS